MEGFVGPGVDHVVDGGEPAVSVPVEDEEVSVVFEDAVDFVEHVVFEWVEVVGVEAYDDVEGFVDVLEVFGFVAGEVDVVVEGVLYLLSASWGDGVGVDVVEGDAVEGEVARC